MKFAKYIGGALVVLFIVTFALPRLSAYDKNQRFKAYNPGMEPCSEIDEQIENSKGGEMLTRCPEPRPQICTREYRPVCAQQSDGTIKSYATGCTACTDPDVTAYREGVCE